MARVIDLVVGRMFFADYFLEMARRTLLVERTNLVYDLDKGDWLIPQRDFVRGVKERYEMGAKSPFYRFASEHSQREYDMAWHGLGFELKQRREQVDKFVTTP